MQAALGVNIDLSNAKGDCFLDHVSRDTCAAVKNQRSSPVSCWIASRVSKEQTLPVLAGYLPWILPIPAARNLRPDHVDSSCTSLGSAHSPIPTTPSSSPPIAPTSASMENALFMSSLNQLSGLFNVLVDRVMRAIEHDGREASFQTLVAAVV